LNNLDNYVHFLLNGAEFIFEKGAKNIACALMLEAVSLTDNDEIKNKKEKYFNFLSEKIILKEDFDLHKYLKSKEAENSNAYISSILLIIDSYTKNINTFEILDINNLYGSRFHYHHYFCSCIVPILEFASTGGLKAENTYLIKDNGPLNYETIDLFSLLNINILILDEEILNLVIDAQLFKKYILSSYERTHNSPSKFLNRLVKDKMFDLCAVLRGISAPKRTLDDINITVVTRVASSEQYKKIGHATGADRRSTPNIEQLGNKLSEKFKHVYFISFENMKLKEKVNILANTDILVIQFGAGMNNMWWMKESSHVIEITPACWLNPQPRKGDGHAYRVLAGHHNINYQQVIQETEHSDIDIDRLYNICLKTSEYIINENNAK